MVVGPTLHALADAVHDLERATKLRPLAFVRAWDSPKTSQRAIVQAVQHYRTILAFGGNRSGKTFIARCILLALILGSDHPDAQAFWVLNGVDPDTLPTGPGRGWIVALTSADSIEYHRSQLIALLPKIGPAHPRSPDGLPYFVWGKDGMGDCKIEICLPGYGTEEVNRAVIVCKADHAGPDGMQGSECRAILHDEESKRHGDKTWGEADTRLWDQNGWHIMTNTPIQGKTWPYWRWVHRGVPNPETEKVLYIHAEDNPHTDKTRLQAWKGSDNPLARAKLYGEFVVLSGRVWPEFDQGVHVIDTVPLPDDAGIDCKAIDFGTRNPFCCLWGVLTKRTLELGGKTIPDGSIVVFREYYQAERTVAQHVRAMEDTWTPEEIRTQVTVADPEDAQAILALQRDHGWPAIKANKSVKVGLDKVSDWLSVDDLSGAPRLYIMDCCQNLIGEIPEYKWAPTAGEEDPKSRPVKKDDHGCDALRYMVMLLAVYAVMFRRKRRDRANKLPGSN